VTCIHFNESFAFRGRAERIETEEAVILINREDAA